MLNLTKPRYVMPVHGDHSACACTRELAEAVGDPAEVDLPRRERPAARDRLSGARFGEREQAGLIFVDGMEVGDIEDVALRDRRMLSADGIFIVVATISEQDGRSVVPPEIIFRGVPFVEEAGRRSSTSSAKRSRSRSRTRPRRRSGDRPPPGPPARRHRRVRLRAPEAPADGAAGRRRG